MIGTIGTTGMIGMTACKCGVFGFMPRMRLKHVAPGASLG